MCPEGDIEMIEDTESTINWGAPVDKTSPTEEMVFCCINCEYIIRPTRTMKLYRKWGSKTIANHWDATGHSYIIGYEKIDKTKFAEEPRSHYFVPVPKKIKPTKPVRR